MNPDSTLSSTHNCPNDGVHLCSVHLTGPIPRCLISPVVGLGLSPIGNGTNDIVRKDCRSPSVTIIGDTSLVPLEISRSVSSVAGTTVPLKERPSDSKSSTLATGLPISSPPSKITGFFAKSSAEVGIGRLNRNGNVFMPCANRPVLREMPKSLPRSQSGQSGLPLAGTSKSVERRGSLRLCRRIQRLLRPPVPLHQKPRHRRPRPRSSQSRERSTPGGSRLDWMSSCPYIGLSSPLISSRWARRVNRAGEPPKLRISKT